MQRNADHAEIPGKSFLRTHYAPYPEIYLLLEELLSGARAILGEQWVGVYLSGSLASGDFDPQRSDIDFVIVTRGELPAAVVRALEEMHTRLAASASPWAKRLEGAYIPQPSLRRYDPASAIYPSVRVGGSFGIDPQGVDGIIQRSILREQAVSLDGPPLQDLIDPVTPGDLRRASLGILHDWWQPQLQDPHRLLVREYQAYAVLTMCRIIYTLQFATIVSKPVAASWAKQALEEKWAGLIDRALSWQPADGVDDLHATLDFIHATLERTAGKA